jgi:hypothetical protein
MKCNFRFFVATGLWLIVVLTTFATTSNAAIIRDDFNDINGASASLKGQGGGSGWSGNWGDANATNAFIVQTYGAEVTAPPSTHFGIPQLQSGDPGFTGTNSVYSNTATQRGITRQLAAPMTGEIWFSYLIQESAGSGIGGMYFPSAHSFLPNNKPRAQVTGSGALQVSIDGTNVVSTGSAINLNANNLIVGRILVGPGGAGSTLEAWANPDVALGPAGLASAPHVITVGQMADGEFAPAGFGAINYAGALGWNQANTTYMDQISLSDGPQGFQDVTGSSVPEPCGAIMSFLGLIGVTFFARRGRLPTRSDD